MRDQHLVYLDYDLDPLQPCKPRLKGDTQESLGGWLAGHLGVQNFVKQTSFIVFEGYSRLRQQIDMLFFCAFIHSQQSGVLTHTCIAGLLTITFSDCSGFFFLKRQFMYNLRCLQQRSRACVVNRYCSTGGGSSSVMAVCAFVYLFKM